MNMEKFKYRFLLGSVIFTFMGAMLKLENYGNSRTSFIVGILSFLVFLYFQLTERKKKLS